MEISSFKCKFIINSFCTDSNKLKKDELIYVLDYMVDSLSRIGFEFRYISLLGFDYNNLDSLSVKSLRFLFNYCKFQYLRAFLGFVTNKKRS